jgi:hypothetical protein
MVQMWRRQSESSLQLQTTTATGVQVSVLVRKARAMCLTQSIDPDKAELRTPPCLQPSADAPQTCGMFVLVCP